MRVGDRKNARESLRLHCGIFPVSSYPDESDSAPALAFVGHVDTGESIVIGFDTYADTTLIRRSAVSRDWEVVDLEPVPLKN